MATWEGSYEHNNSDIESNIAEESVNRGEEDAMRVPAAADRPMAPRQLGGNAH